MIQLPIAYKQSKITFYLMKKDKDHLDKQLL